MARREDKPRGLPSLAEARAERRRTLAQASAGLRSLPPQLWLWLTLAIGAFFVVQWRLSLSEVESEKSAVMAKQRAMAQSLGPQILPFRDKIERWAAELAGSDTSDRVAPGSTFENLASEPAVYLRLRLQNATDVERLRAAAARSLHDGFTSCFFERRGAPDPTSGPPCASVADCDPGLLCNEYNHCLPPPEPFNMRLAYRSLRVLSSAWTDELHEATSTLAIKAYERDLDRVTREDVPIAARILSRAKHFVLVLDEDPPDGLPAAADAGVAEAETEEERVQRVSHHARVGVWNLQSGEQLVRLRRRAEGRAIPVGQSVVKRVESIHAQSRQVVSCALALDVRQAIAPPTPVAPAGDAGVDAGLATDAAVAP